MSYLGIDYGTKRIGVAVSSEDDSLAFPFRVLAAGKGAAGEVAAMARERGAQKVVVGESRDFTGKPNPVMKDIEVFAEALRAEGLEVIFELEFLTSAAAMKIDSASALRGRQRGVAAMKEAMQKNLDASAAALILQSYLDRIGNKE